MTNTKPPSTDQQEDTDTTGVDIQIENTQDEVPTTEDTGDPIMILIPILIHLLGKRKRKRNRRYYAIL